LKQQISSLLASSHRTSAIKRLRDLEYLLPSAQTRFAVPFVLKGRGHFRSIRPRQTPSEISQLYDNICQLNPKVVLEIGTAKGGTLYLWAQAATDDALIISIDLPGGQFGGGYLTCRTPFYKAFARPDQTMELLREDSHTEQTLGKIKATLGDQQVDFLFIDGDHLYPGVRDDFLQYGPLVRPGGFIGFHDIMPAPHDPNIQVSQLWDQIKGVFQSQQFLGVDSSQRKIGIGLIRVPDDGFPNNLQLK
jgi:predicted O-methyltransferase YrrM